ncbi:uncharacterized protein VNE69_07042 [Vairimorpha necatrix]|uniref:Uncharacterized protein n=1 Tax=Vairimorpha necatrix TaxID=6039 RepID=A0AAX4JDM7_9MICR
MRNFYDFPFYNNTHNLDDHSPFDKYENIDTYISEHQDENYFILIKKYQHKYCFNPRLILQKDINNSPHILHTTNLETKFGILAYQEFNDFAPLNFIIEQDRSYKSYIYEIMISLIQINNDTDFFYEFADLLEIETLWINKNYKIKMCWVTFLILNEGYFDNTIFRRNTNELEGIYELIKFNKRRIQKRMNNNQEEKANKYKDNNFKGTQEGEIQDKKYEENEETEDNKKIKQEQEKAEREEREKDERNRRFLDYLIERSRKINAKKEKLEKMRNNKETISKTPPLKRGKLRTFSSAKTFGTKKLCTEKINKEKTQKIKKEKTQNKLKLILVKLLFNKEKVNQKNLDIYISKLQNIYDTKSNEFFTLTDKLISVLEFILEIKMPIFNEMAKNETNEFIEKFVQNIKIKFKASEQRINENKTMNKMEEIFRKEMERCEALEEATRIERLKEAEQNRILEETKEVEKVENTFEKKGFDMTSYKTKSYKKGRFLVYQAVPFIKDKETNEGINFNKIYRIIEIQNKQIEMMYKTLKDNNKIEELIDAQLESLSIKANDMLTDLEKRKE